ncbi:hypothetical protein [Bradyrhizobium sp. AZCC 2230]|uniref:hypothetical protein n=1 Tax=Bradyrhizobium sp. AZCC 2230 TaxID=3117021 RepID=UPI002FEEC501
MSRKPTKSKTPMHAKSKTPRPQTRTVVMFGLDKERKPHAARFSGESDALLSKAAATMGMRLAVPISKKHFEVVSKLPAGKINATGNGLVPSVDQKLYDQINSLVGGETGAISPSLPKSWTELAPGHLVLAQDGVEDGWWEATITKRSADALTLRWRDYPGQSEFIRPIGAVALLKPQ